ncbi:YggT family protein [Periweissella fabalis]|uniref:YggT family protein n=1 Tax=Periweissella fabalis TaxID=1070421 RepID=A0A7X6N4R6_9LACO|nr:YggT family protein [Periweissella fabalis]MCM0598787.1 YggT family protein [Periweissella fabalis]NKZ24614.1 YggT family protein [Periweissella fabalis]
MTLYTILNFINIAIQIYTWLIIANALMSWLPGAYQSKLGRIITRLVQPFLDIFRFIPTLGGIDFSPLIAIIVLEMAQQGLLAVFRLLIN